MKKSFGKYVGNFKSKKYGGPTVSGHPANPAATSVGKEFEKPPTPDVYHGMTDAFKEVLGIQHSQCKLPRTYRPSMYEELPDYVEKDPGPLPPEEIDNTDWSDGTATSDEIKDKFRPLPTILADKSCNYHIQPHEILVQCPYVRSHKILEGRVLRHLNKCRRNYIKQRTAAGKIIEISVCPYFTLHHVLDCRMADHLKTCPKALELARDRQTFDKLYEKSLAKKNEEFGTSFTSAGTNSYGETSLSDISNTNHLEENWELDEPVPAYDPSIKLMESTSFFYNPQGLTRSERRKFREAQRVRCLREKTLKKEREQNAGFRECFAKGDEDDDQDEEEDSSKENDYAAEEEIDMDDGNVEK